MKVGRTMRFATLLILLYTASKNGWNIWSRLAVAGLATAVLIESVNEVTGWVKKR